jgi:Dolichyl-phosphate-mannose-protein mannosyltransferase
MHENRVPQAGKLGFLWASLVVWIVIQLPFASGAFRIDEPYHLKAAEHLQSRPADPYGFYINWNGTPEWAFHTYASPPLVPEWLALWSRIFPRNEFSLHVSMLPFSVGALLAFGLLANSYGLDARLAMALLACSPAFFLTSQVVMPDIAMLCLFLVAVTGARLYQLNGRMEALLVAVIAAFSCPLAKYNGVVIVPVLICFALARPRRIEMIGIAIAPVLSLILFGGFTWVRYGAVHFIAMSAYQRSAEMSTHPAVITVGVFAATGIGVLPLALLLFLVRVPKQPRLILAVDTVSLISSIWLGLQLGYPPISIFLFAASIGFSTHVLCLALQQGWKTLRGFDWGCLAVPVWYLAAFVFQYGVMFTATRYVVFLAPPAILMVMRATTAKPRHAVLGLALGANLLLVISIAVGDLLAANLYRTFAGNEVKALRGSQNRVFFAGHWGFQYYAERAGGELIDKRKGPQLQSGDSMVIAKMPWPSLLEPVAAAGLEFEHRSLLMNRSWPVRTLSCKAGISFHGNAISGCVRPTLLPFGFSSEPWEEFLVYQTRRP